MSDKRSRIREFLNSVDWNTYDFRNAPGADMTFPDFEGDDEDREFWSPQHYNKTLGMKCRHVPDLNQINSGRLRRLWALYGMPVEWDFDDEALVKGYIVTIEAARAQGAAVFEQTMSRHGIINEEHLGWMKMRASGDGAFAKIEAQALLDTRRDELKQQMQDRLQGELQGEMQPVEGVSLEQWAHLQAASASGQDVSALLASQKIDSARWQRVSAEWNARMARDTTASIATAYGQAFSGAGQGQFAAAGQTSAASMMTPGAGVEGTAEPFSFERWVEITVAQEAGSAQGADPAAVLAQFGMTAADWGTASGWWSQKFNANAMAMLEDYNRHTAQFRAKYGLQETDETGDELEERVKKDIVAMAKNGRGVEILPYLKKTFPDDADDNDALDHHVDQAADVVGEEGDRKAALVLLKIRYALQEDEEDPENEWIESAMDLLF